MLKYELLALEFPAMRMMNILKGETGREKSGMERAMEKKLAPLWSTYYSKKSIDE